MKVSKRKVLTFVAATSTILPILTLTSMGSTMMLEYVYGSRTEFDENYQILDMAADGDGNDDDENFNANNNLSTKTIDNKYHYDESILVNDGETDEENKDDDFGEIDEEIEKQIQYEDLYQELLNYLIETLDDDEFGKFVEIENNNEDDQSDNEALKESENIRDNQNEIEDRDIENEKEVQSKSTKDDKEVQSESTQKSNNDSNNEEKNDNESMKEGKDEQPPRPHPFAGARDANGQWGYVADVTAVRKRHLELHSNKEFAIPKDHVAYEDVCEKEAGEYVETYAGFELLKKIQIGKEGGDEVNKKPKPKLLCAIYTYEKMHDRLEAAADSWGWKCDGFLAASTLTNETIGAVDLPHLGEEMYDNMWQKTRSIWGYIYENYLDEYDFFWLGGDDFFMVVENMVNYLATLDQSQILYRGHRIPKTPSFTYCGGGGGYVLNKVALKRFAEEALPNCYNEKIISSEDRLMSKCMKGNLKIECQSTVDAKGQQRFPGMDASVMAKYDGTHGFFKHVYEFWAKESGEFKVGIDLISEHATGFHWLRNPSHIMRYHAILHSREACPKDSKLVQSVMKYYSQEDEGDENDHDDQYLEEGVEARRQD